MGGEWREVSLSVLYDISSGLSKPAKDFGSGYPFLAFKDVFYNFFVPEKLLQSVKSSEKERQTCSIKRGDVFLTRTSETMNELGMSSVALRDYDNATFNGFTKRLRPKSHDQIVPEYVGYYLRSPKFRAKMLAFSTMSTRASLNNEMIGHLTITLPSVKEQKSISWILKKIDDKIELNRQMNTTLESIAQALFKSWFVDFDPVIDNALAAGNPIPEPFQVRAKTRKALGDNRKPLPEAIRQQFPSRFTFTEEMGWIPEGWSEGILEDMLVLQRGFDLPKSQRTDGYYPLMVASGQDGTHNEYKVKGPGITTGRSGKLGEVNFVYRDFWPLNTTLWVKEYKNSSPYHALYLLRSLGLELYNSGSAVPTLNRNHVHNIQLLVPPKLIIESHRAMVERLYEKMHFNFKEIAQVALTRDTLLPKLLSGQLRIPDAEKLTADAL